MRELDNYQQWQMENKGNILPTPITLPSGDVEGTNEEISRHEEWVHQQAELQLWDYDKD